MRSRASPPASRERQNGLSPSWPDSLDEVVDGVKELLEVVGAGLVCDIPERPGRQLVVQRDDDGPLLTGLGVNIPEFQVAAGLTDPPEAPFIQGFDDVFAGIRPSRPPSLQSDGVRGLAVATRY